MKSSIKTENFKRATRQTPIFKGNSEGQDWTFRVRLKISSEIEIFKRDEILSIFGPLGFLGGRQSNRNWAQTSEKVRCRWQRASCYQRNTLSLWWVPNPSFAWTVMDCESQTQVLLGCQILDYGNIFIVSPKVQGFDGKLIQGHVLLGKDALWVPNPNFCLENTALCQALGFLGKAMQYVSPKP